MNINLTERQVKALWDEVDIDGYKYHGEELIDIEYNKYRVAFSFEDKLYAFEYQWDYWSSYSTGVARPVKAKPVIAYEYTYKEN